MRGMAGYTMVNLKEVEDQAPKFGYAPDMQARFARGPLELEKSGLSYFRIAPGFRAPFGHKHSEQEEIYLLVGGSARIKLDDDVIEMRPFDAVRIPVETMRCFEAGPDGAEIIAFGAPNTGNRDIDLAPGWWSD
jgi:mannose-6-phosphate isomerase-like protein (cupin superfamily)